MEELTTKPPEASGPDLPLTDSHSLSALAKLVATLQSSEKEVAYATSSERENGQDGRALDGADDPTTSEIDRGTGPAAVPIRPGQAAPSRIEAEQGGAR